MVFAGFGHLKNIYDYKELSTSSTVAKNATVRLEGEQEVMLNMEYYNLDVRELYTICSRIDYQQVYKRVLIFNGYIFCP